MQQHFVRETERVLQRRVLVADLDQTIVRDDDQRVDAILQFLDPGFRLQSALLPLEAERPRCDTDRQRTERTRDFRDDRRCTGSGTAALAGRDEDHVRTLEDFFDLFAVIVRGLTAELRIRTRTESAGQRATDVELHVGIRHEQCLRVGVHRDELDAAQSGFDHAVDGVHATATHADHLDHREVALWCCRHVHASTPGRFLLLVFIPRRAGPASPFGVGSPAFGVSGSSGREVNFEHNLMLS